MDAEWERRGKTHVSIELMRTPLMEKFVRLNVPRVSELWRGRTAAEAAARKAARRVKVFMMSVG